jgi:hypothetical protein
VLPPALGWFGTSHDNHTAFDGIPVWTRLAAPETTPVGGAVPRFAANLNLQFNDVPMLERYGRAAAAGFSHVEVLFPY